MTNRQVQSTQILAAAFQTALGRQDWDAARAAGQKLARQLPDNASVIYNLGLVEKTSGSLKTAIVEFRKTLALDPAHHNARFELAGCLMEATQLPEARKQYDAYLAQKPDDPDALLNLGRVLLRLDQPLAALSCLTKASVTDPAETTMIALATALRDLGRLDEARALLEQLARTPETAALRLKIMTQGPRGRFSLAAG